jgi:hypothetical protein
MTTERSRYGLFVSALGAFVLAASVFLPWYEGSSAAPDSALIGHHGGALTGQQALRGLGVLLLVLAALALLDAVFAIARSVSVTPDGAGSAVVVLGVLASACVIYRMAQPPADLGAALTASLRVGAWTALLGSLMISLGGLWPRALPGIVPGEGLAPDLWSTLTGCAPGGPAGNKPLA